LIDHRKDSNCGPESAASLKRITGLDFGTDPVA